MREDSNRDAWGTVSHNDGRQAITSHTAYLMYMILAYAYTDP